MSNPTSTPVTRNPPVQISDEFIMPREVALRILVCDKISNSTRKRARRAMQTATLSRVPILQEMNFVAEGKGKIEKGDRVYNLAQAPKTFDQNVEKLVKRLTMRQLINKLKRIPAQRKQSQWAYQNSPIEKVRQAASQLANALDEIKDAVEIEIARRTSK